MSWLWFMATEEVLDLWKRNVWSLRWSLGVWVLRVTQGGITPVAFGCHKNTSSLAKIKWLSIVWVGLCLWQLISATGAMGGRPVRYAVDNYWFLLKVWKRKSTIPFLHGKRVLLGTYFEKEVAGSSNGMAKRTSNTLNISELAAVAFL